MSSKNQKSLGRLLYPIEGGKIPVRDIMTDEGERTYIDFGTYDYITKKALDGFTPVAQVLAITAVTTDNDQYALSAPQLAILNAYGRYPNFVAIVTASGQQFFDIYPTYTGTVGAFTACTVQLHSDGVGSNAEDTVIQFS